VAIWEMDRPRGLRDTGMRWGSDAMAAMLRALDLQYVALNPGSSYRGLHDSLVNYLGNEAPHMLVCLHEEHAVAMAHGYAKVCGRPMGVILHSNVGLMHAAMAIFNAWCDCVPVVIVGATGAVDAARRRPWIEWIHTAKDQGALLRPYLKWDDQPASIPAAMESLLRAHQLAVMPPCGPVYVTMDVSLQEDPLESPLTLPEPARYRPAPSPRPEPGDVRRAAQWLAGAERPLLMIGRVSRGQGAWEERVRLAEALGAVVLTDFKQGAAFPLEHPLHGATPEFRLNAVAEQALRGADVILSLDWVDLAGTLHPAWENAPVTAKVIHCSLDSYSHRGWGMEYMGLPPVDLPMLTESDVLVPLLLRELEAAGGAELRARAERRIAARAGGAGNGEGATGGAEAELTTTDIARELYRATEGREVCLIRLPFGWDAAQFPLRGPLEYLGYDGGAGLGSGPGMAVGGALALLGRGRLPIAVLGRRRFPDGRHGPVDGLPL